MKANYRTWMAGLAMLGLAVITNRIPPLNAAASAVRSNSAPLGAYRWKGQLLPAAFVGADDGDRHDDPDSIVGLWHVKFVVQSTGSSQSTTIDARLQQWHSDGTEIIDC